VSTQDAASRIAFEAAEQRVLGRLRIATPARSPRRRAARVAIAAALFAVTFAARLAIDDPSALIANFYVIPIVIVAVEFGTRGGVLGTGVAMVLVVAWGVINDVDVNALGYSSRGAVLLVAGTMVGRFSDRLRLDIAQRQRTQHDLALYADELERANDRLTLSVQRLEAFSEIAKAVGGETELERVLTLIAARGRAIVGARSVLVCLADGDELVAIGAGAPQRLARGDSLAGEVTTGGVPLRIVASDRRLEHDVLLRGAEAAILVPLVFQGEILGVLVGIDRSDGRPFEPGDEQLLLSVAASAATAVATARSVAAEHLRLSLEAAEHERAHWARELHDETLQGLTGVRMVLGAGLGRDDQAALRRAAEAADAHLDAEIRRLRELITELRPAALDDLGLGPAIESLAHRQAAAGGFALDVGLELGTHAAPRSGELEGAVYRIVQEALSNVVHHAEAAHVTLSVRQGPAAITVAVTDDGCGFEPGASTEGFGLAGMRERALLLGGSFSVDSAAGGPTSVTAAVPLHRGVDLRSLSPASSSAGRPTTS
jgi:signal transduction histidine kinase